jgi:2-polyprenyl-6-methoxyphenol hydroxylase-like FAD-dependent oxidoreductase
MKRGDRAMRIVCIGGGPAGLYFGLLMKKRHPEHTVTVIERNKPYDTFGWGVVFSDAMMSAMRAADPESAAEIADAFNHWDDIELVFKGSRQRTTGHGFIGIGRKQLLNILQRRCEALGVELAFRREVDSDLEFPDADLIVAADGFNSKIRHDTPSSSGPIFSSAPTATFGSASPRRSTRSPSTSARRSTAGSRPTSTSSTEPHRLSLSKRQATPSRRTGWANSIRTARSHSARRFSHRPSTARSS